VSERLTCYEKIVYFSIIPSRLSKYSNKGFEAIKQPQHQLNLRFEYISRMYNGFWCMSADIGIKFFQLSESTSVTEREGEDERERSRH
jgi:hypothetical protein